MTFSSLINKHIYAGNGVTTEWPYTFPIISEDGSDILVYLTDPDGEETLLTTGYTVDVDNAKVIYPAVTDPLTDPMASGYELTLKRAEPLTQLLDLIAQGDFNAENIEIAFDKITMVAQDLQEQISRCLKIGVSYDTDAAETASAYGYAEAAQTAQNLAEAAQALAEVAQAAAEAAQTAAEAAQTAAEAALDDYVLGPATNTNNYIPLWNGANSKTLKNGVEKSTDGNFAGNSDDAIPTEKATNIRIAALIAAVAKIRGSTKVIAANDSIDKTNVDYVCDGTADEVQIQAAVDALTTGGSGGRIILLEGTYNIEALISLTTGDDDIIIQGQGWGTILKAKTNLNAEVLKIQFADRVVVKDLKIDVSTNSQSAAASAILLSGADYCMIENVFITHSYVVETGKPLDITDCDYIRVENNRIFVGGGGYANHGAAIRLSGASVYATIKGNLLDCSGCSVNGSAAIGGLGDTGGFGKSIIANNIIIGDGADLDYGIFFGNHADYRYNVITGNLITNCHLKAIELDDNNGGYCTIVGNSATDGIQVDNPSTSLYLAATDSDPLND